MATPETPAPTIPLVRDCRPGGLRPLLAPGGREPYFAPDLQRMMFPPDELLARFLPPAKWTMPAREERSQGGQAAQVTYTIPDDIIKTAQPLTTLPRSEIDAFAQAVDAFLAKARPDAKSVTPYMRQCRQEFRLPNPEFDPEAYWVYGPEFDRRLLILWGVETQGGMSLPLEKATEKIRGCEMSWRDKQDMALQLAMRPEEPLSRFLARRTADGGLQIGSSVVAAKKLVRMKTISPSECRAFEAAAKAYYAKAHGGGTAAPFERELRTEMRLPSLAKVPGDYYRVGGKLVIALDTWPVAVCIPATEDAELKLPAAAAAASPTGPLASGGETVSSQLKAHQEPAWVAYAKMAAVFAVLAGAGAGAWLFRPDHRPPQFRSIEPTDKNTVVIVFDEELDPASIQPRAVAGQAPTDPLTFLESKLEIADRTLRSPDRRAVILHTKTPLKHGEQYELGIKLVTDKKHNAIEPLSKPVVFFDKAAPKLVEVSAGGPSKRHLILVFSKDMSDDFRKARFEIAPIDGDQRGRKIPVTPTLDPEQKKVILLEASDDFVENKPYVIDVSGVIDNLEPQPNAVAEDGATNRKFDYVNRLPPALRGGPIANGGQYQVKLQFNGRLDAARAKDPANYALTAPDGSKLRVKAGGISLDETETLVTLELEPVRLSAAKHKLHIENLATKLGVAMKAPVEVPFEFNDSTNRTPLSIPKVERNGPRLTLQFDRAVSTDSAFVVSHYRVVDSDRRPVNIDVTKAEAISGQTAGVALELSRVPGAGKYYIEASGLVDVFGNTQAAPALGGFEVSGISIRAISLIDWATPPVLRSGGQLLVISISDKVTKASAENLANYSIEPSGVKIQKVESFKPGTDDQPVTTVTLRLAAPPTAPISVSAQGLILQSHPTRGPQTLSMRPAQLAP